MTEEEMIVQQFLYSKEIGVEVREPHTVKVMWMVVAQYPEIKFIRRYGRSYLIHLERYKAAKGIMELLG